MLTNSFQELKLSRLGFGTMRLPLREDKSIDVEQVDAMVDYAMAHGVNYFDTAYPYHGGLSEKVMGRSLGRYPRESWYLATKFPGHQIASSYDPAAVFEEQLQKCGVDYFDFYLLHNVYENSISVYTDPEWGILPYFLEQKRRGRVRHLGFSSHARLETLERFLDYAGEQMEFCQIQLNYLDWTLQQGREKYELLTRRGIPVWVMEPLRGGKLAALPDRETATLRALRPQEGTPGWAFRFLLDLPNVKMILSGMSSFEQMADNVATFEADSPLTGSETAKLLELAEGMKDTVPCTGCRYCTESCPMGLDIPMFLSLYNELRFQATLNPTLALDALPADKRPEACLACGACMRMCPQGIHIPDALADLAREVAKLPRWADICREREEAAKRARA